MDHRPPRPDQPYAWDDERLSAYLDGELSAPEQAQLEARLVVDAELRQLVDELRAVRQQLEILPEYRLPTTFAEQVLRRAEQEILLSPLGHEPVMAPGKAAPAALPVVSAPAIELAPTRVPSFSASRLWRRGAIWTAVAAAAVLLLIVTNQPREPQQVHVAQQDLPEGITLETGAAKSGAAQTPNPMANSAAANGPADATAGPVPNGDQAQGFGPIQADAKQQAASNESANKRMEVFTPGTSQERTDEQSPLLKQGVSADAVSSDDSSDYNSSTRINPLALPGESLLKNKAATPLLATPEMQAAQPREQLPAKLAELLVSDEFLQLAGTQDGKSKLASAEEQVLVVYLTPRANQREERFFESLLASNSIELAEKSLAFTETTNGLRTLPAPIAKLEGTLAKSLPKSSPNKQQPPERKHRQPANQRELGNSENASNSPAPMQEENTQPASELAQDQVAAAGDKLYYLEADSDQVDELLRQLRTAPDRFSRMSFAGRGMSEDENRSSFRDEKSLAIQSSSPLSNSDAGPAPASSEPPGQQVLGNQQPGAAQQLAQAVAPALPAGAESAGTPLPRAAAAEAAMPFAAPAPTSPPTTALPRTPLPGVAPLAANKRSDAPGAKGDVASSSSGLPQPVPSSAGPALQGQPNDGLGNDARANGQGIQMDKSLSQAIGDRVIAYRLRGVESLKFAKDAKAIESNQGANGSGGATFGQGGFSNAQETEAANSDTNEKSAALKSNASLKEQKSDGLLRGQAARNADARKALETKPKDSAREMAEPGKSEPDKMEPMKKREPKPTPQAKPESDPEHSAVVGEVAKSQMTRDKETVITAEKAPADAAKKAAVPRLRVLFVIQDQPHNE